jgi:cysteine-rich repeat protein
MMFRSFLRLALCTLVLSMFACSSEVTRTQITFRLAASTGFARRIESLKVVVRNNGDQTATFGKAELNFPVEIVVLPEAGNRSTDEITLLVTAFGAGGTVISDQRSSARFEPERVVTQTVALDTDAVTEEDAGPTRDASVPANDAGDAPSKDAGTEPTPTDAGPDVPPPVKNCATPGSGIDCDDKNPCNGKEGCNPGSSSALPNGCVPSDSPVTCPNEMTCDRTTGECSSCARKPDGDGDGADSIACGGKDCDDNDPAVAPGKSETCDGKDNDCDGSRDGVKADPSCKASAPRGGTASCVAGACVPVCNDKTQQITNGVCAPVPVSCPIVNPCAPGSCAGGSPTYSCTCPAGYRAGLGMTRCAAVGVPARSIGFEATCDGMATPGVFDAMTGLKKMDGNLYAACGVASFTSGALMAEVQLIKPLTVVEGITRETAAVVTPGLSTAGFLANSELAIAFAPPVNELSFDILDIDNPLGLTVALRSGANVVPVPAVPTPAVGTRQTRFKYASTSVPVDLVTITYTPFAAADALYIDELSYRVGGCGDGVTEGTEACDDGNTVQCDGCDNACALSSKGCLSAGACLAAGATSENGCTLCDTTVIAPLGSDIAPKANPGAPASCAP